MGRSVQVGGAQSIRRVVAILRILASGQEQGMRITDIARESELNRATVHRMLRALIEVGLAEQNVDTRRYVIGHEAALLGLARRSTFRIQSIAGPFLRALSEQSGDSVFLSVRSGNDSICVDRCTGAYPIQVLSVEVGARRPLGVGVGGVVLLAFLDAAEADQIVRANERRVRASIGISRQQLVDRIGEARERGYAYVDKGYVPGTRAIAVPVLANDGRAVAAISISTVSARLMPGRARELAGLMREHASAMARKLAR